MRTPTDSRPCRSIAQVQADMAAQHLGRWARFTPEGPGTFVVDDGVYVPAAVPPAPVFEKLDLQMLVIFLACCAFWAGACFMIVGYQRGWFQ